MQCIGKGGFGKVMAVLHRPSNTFMAVKRMTKVKLAKKGSYLRTMWVERNLLEMFQSAFLNKAYFMFQDQYECFMVMPLFRGGSLQYYLNTKGQLEPAHVKFYTAEIVLGLEELRRFRIVYRDMKPDNLLFDDLGHVVLTDFGLCKRLRKAKGYKIKGTAGTPTFMAPEILKKRSYDYGVDYFATGVTICLLASLKRPFLSDKDVMEYNMQGIQGLCPGDLQMQDFVTKMLAKDPKKRLGTMHPDDCDGLEGIDQLKKHRWFTGFDFKMMSARGQPAPYRPDVSEMQASSDNIAQDLLLDDDPADGPKPTPEMQKKFDGFDFNTEYSEDKAYSENMQLVPVVAIATFDPNDEGVQPRSKQGSITGRISSVINVPYILPPAIDCNLSFDLGEPIPAEKRNKSAAA